MTPCHLANATYLTVYFKILSSQQLSVGISVLANSCWFCSICRKCFIISLVKTLLLNRYTYSWQWRPFLGIKTQRRVMNLFLLTPLSLTTGQKQICNSIIIVNSWLGLCPSSVFFHRNRGKNSTNSPSLINVK